MGMLEAWEPVEDWGVTGMRAWRMADCHSSDRPQGLPCSVAADTKYVPAADAI